MDVTDQSDRATLESRVRSFPASAIIRHIYVGIKAILFIFKSLNPTATESSFGNALSEFMKDLTTDGWLHKSLTGRVTHPRSPDAHIQPCHDTGHRRPKEIGHVHLIYS